MCTYQGGVLYKNEGDIPIDSLSVFDDNQASYGNEFATTARSIVFENAEVLQEIESNVRFANQNITLVASLRDEYNQVHNGSFMMRLSVIHRQSALRTMQLGFWLALLVRSLESTQLLLGMDGFTSHSLVSAILLV